MQQSTFQQYRSTGQIIVSDNQNNAQLHKRKREGVGHVSTTINLFQLMSTFRKRD